MGYTGARGIVKRAGRRVGIDLKPHDLRRHAATYASQAGAPREIVSKIILSMQIFQPHRFISDLLAIQRL